jgi:hypothetical protein
MKKQDMQVPRVTAIDRFREKMPILLANTVQLYNKQLIKKETQ